MGYHERQRNESVQPRHESRLTRQCSSHSAREKVDAQHRHESDNVQMNTTHVTANRNTRQHSCVIGDSSLLRKTQRRQIHKFVVHKCLSITETCPRMMVHRVKETYWERNGEYQRYDERGQKPAVQGSAVHGKCGTHYLCHGNCIVHN